MNAIKQAWIVAQPSALFVVSAVGNTDALVIAAAGAVVGTGAIALVALFVPGSLHGAIKVMTQEHAS